MSVRDRIINEILEREGEAYTNDPKDSGGPTKWGVTEKVARDFGYMGHMQDLDRSKAFEIMVKRFWDPVRGDQLERLSPMIAAEVADTAVNCGQYRAILFLQRSLNVLNVDGTLYPQVVVDGLIGPGTMNAVKNYLEVRSEEGLNTALNCLQGAFYIDLAERRPKDQRFVYGWLNHRIVL